MKGVIFSLLPIDNITQYFCLDLIEFLQKAVYAVQWLVADMSGQTVHHTHGVPGKR